MFEYVYPLRSVRGRIALVQFAGILRLDTQLIH